MNFLSQHLIGLKDADKGVTLHWYFNEFVGGGKMTCTILASYFSKIPNLEKKTVYIQLDNTVSDNKCWLVMQFLMMCVAMKKIKKVFVNFLPVGHTHIDIDQVSPRFRNIASSFWPPSSKSS